MEKYEFYLVTYQLSSKSQCTSLKLNVDLKRNMDFRDCFLSLKEKKNRIVMANETVLYVTTVYVIENIIYFPWK